VGAHEAFASQVVYWPRTARIDPEKLNVNGGSISIGPSVRMTGSRMVGPFANEMLRQGALRIVTMCVGGGQGAAGLFEAYN